MTLNRILGVLLSLAVLLGWWPQAALCAAAVRDLTSACSGVVCPSSPCKKHFAYLHRCCPVHPVCDCLDETARVFRPLQSSWLTQDCKRSCKCVNQLDMSTYTRKPGAKCEPLRCPTSKSGCIKGWERCCPFCKPTPPPNVCHSEALGRNFNNGETWQPSPCRKCTCVSGRSVCTHLECAPLSCPPDLTPKTLPKACCPSFCRNSTSTISPYQSCRDPTGNRTFAHLASHRPKWPCSPLTCICRHGEWECDSRTALCPSRCANNRNVTLGKPGQCCPLCIGRMSCHIGDGEYRSAGHTWLEPTRSQQCVCIHGVVECISVPLSLFTTSRPPPSALAPSHLVSTWIPILLVVLSVLILFFILATAFVLRHRCSFVHLPGHRPTAGQGPHVKASLAMHHMKNGEAEGMMGDVDENANQRSEPLLT